MNKFFKNVFNKGNLSKIIIIFIVGFVSRSMINNIYSINVFTDYTNSVSVIYYIFMAFMTVLIHETVGYFDFPTINLEVLKISSIRKGISNIISYYNNKSTITFSRTTGLEDSKKSSLYYYKNGDSISKVPDKGTESAGVKGLYPSSSHDDTYKSAALKGLYSQNSKSNIVKSSGLSLKDRFLSKLYWHSWKQFTHHYNSYNDYKLSLSSNTTVSKEIKKDFKDIKKIFKW